MRCLPPTQRSLRDALALAPALLERARAEGAPWIAASLIEGPAILLGAAQRAGRVVDLGACAAAGIPVLRRATTGPAVYLGGRGVAWTLALPHVAALAADASARTLVNRNVRGFLQGFARAGALAHYFGREWISAHRRPAAALAVESAPDGAAILEVWAGYDAPTAIPAALAAPEELAVDRWLGKSPAALAELLPPSASLADLGRAVIDAVAARSPGAIVEDAALPPLAPERFVEVTDQLDPLPPGARPRAMERVPVGWIEAGGGDEVGAPIWIGGDVLTGAWVLEAIGAGRGAPLDPDAVVLEGAKLEELVALAGRARGG
ncbi:MAG TPA: hypothetical protein VLS89_13145 [Candidatus Nanopelagicales bacterium]|nr:hypothetical protein [Candidatus Nanopelagicales bacterium]